MSLKTDVELYHGYNAIAIKHTADGPLLIFSNEGSEPIQLPVSRKFLLLLEEAIQDYRYNLSISSQDASER